MNVTYHLKGHLISSQLICNMYGCIFYHGSFFPYSVALAHFFLLTILGITSRNDNIWMLDTIGKGILFPFSLYDCDVCGSMICIWMLHTIGKGI